MKLSLLAFSWVLCLIGNAQINLVPDSSFEEYSKCPKGITTPNKLVLSKWVLPTKGSTDYYNLCSDNFANSIPRNKAGYQNPKSGNGYIGLSTRMTFAEYVQCELLEPLKKDSIYLVCFWVNLSDKSGKATNKLGVWFGENEIRLPNFEDPLELCPQIKSGRFIYDTLNWVKISDRYLAKGGERFLVLGCFPKSNKDFENIKFNKNSFFKHLARYNVDDVTVVQLRKDGKPKRPMPIEEEKQYVAGDKVVLPEITFEENEWTLSVQVLPKLDTLFMNLKEGELRLKINGYTDDIGSEDDNIILSENRAKAVKEYLIAKGIAEERIEIKGFGGLNPIASNETEEGRSKNRRVEILILKPK